jgi:Uma2 family endonuclease
MVVPVYYTAEMVRALPDDGQRYETVHGELLVTPAPSPPHQVVVRRLLVALDRYLEIHDVGVVLPSPADISWAPDVLVQPDVFVADRSQVRTGQWESVKTLLLAIEVLSPGTQRYDRFTKRRLYQEVGVPVYWIVDIENQAVEVWTPEATLPAVEVERVTWHPEAADAPLNLELAELFKEA